MFSLGEATFSKKVDRDQGGTVVVWHIVLLIFGVVIERLLSCVVSCSRCKFSSKKPRQSNREPSKPQFDKTYQELDLTKLNTEDNYQSLTVNQSAKHDNGNDDSTYTELSKSRKVESSYQSNLSLEHLLYKTDSVRTHHNDGNSWN